MLCQWQKLLIMLLTILESFSTENVTVEPDTSVPILVKENQTIGNTNSKLSVGSVSTENSRINTSTNATKELEENQNIYFPELLRVPNYHELSAWGTFFEEGTEPHNVTVKLGTTVQLDCKIGLLYDKTVSWMRRKGDSIHLLTVGRNTYSVDQRIQLSFRYPNNWRLQITSVTRRDDGLYECQVSGQPPIFKSIYLKVLAPEVEILDEKGHPVSERYYKAGSTIKLSCVAKQSEGNPSDSIVWSRANIILFKGITTILKPGEIISNLKISKAQKHYSGKYTCTVDQFATASVTLHILNGELPAAIHGNCAVNLENPMLLILSIILVLLVTKIAHIPHR